MMAFNTENLLLIGSILVFTAIVLSKTGYRWGVPALLIFLLVGMGFGSDGLGIVFNNYHQAQFVGVAALAVILFTGGMETKISSIKPVLKQGILLSTVGVCLTVLFTGAFIFFLTRIENISLSLSIVMCFLLAAVMSSTDSASVFNILKTSKLRLKENIQPTLELESGSNDPMAYVITIVLIQAATILFDPAAATEGINYTSIILSSLWILFKEIALGGLFGVGIGFGAYWLLRKVDIHSSPLNAIMLLSVSLFTISITQISGGNGYLAVYIAGLIIGNKQMNDRKAIISFLDGMTWIMQIGMFLTLGLLVNPNDMLKVAPVALLIGLFLIFVARPLSVFIILAFVKNLSLRAKIFISWVGLKGAVPIIFATYPIVAGVPGSEQIFNIVFFITILSMGLQGMTVPKVAHWLHLARPQENKPDTFGIEIPEEAGKMKDYVLTNDDLSEGNTLKEISLPEGARVVIIKRDEKFIVPDGTVHLKAGDKLLMIIADNVQNAQ
jgi:cell volume regulation protein A